MAIGRALAAGGSNRLFKRRDFGPRSGFVDRPRLWKWSSAPALFLPPAA